MHKLKGVFSEYLETGAVYKYTPPDMVDTIFPPADSTVQYLTGEAVQLYYDDRLFQEPPVTNWWELTELQWQDRVYWASPTRSDSTFAFIQTLVQNEALMVNAYYDLYGVPIDDPENEGAGRIFLRKLAENGVNYCNSSDEVPEAVGAPGTTEPALGIMISS